MADHVTLTSEQRELARHALGLPNSKRRSYRNHYVGETPEWEQMVEIGAARKRAGSDLTGGDPLYRLTLDGARAALNPTEHLDPEDFPPSRAATRQHGE